MILFLENFLCTEKFSHPEKQESSVWVTAEPDELLEVWSTQDV